MWHTRCTWFETFQQHHMHYQHLHTLDGQKFPKLTGLLVIITDHMIWTNKVFLRSELKRVLNWILNCDWFSFCYQYLWTMETNNQRPKSLRLRDKHRFQVLCNILFSKQFFEASTVRAGGFTISAGLWWAR